MAEKMFVRLELDEETAKALIVAASKSRKLTKAQVTGLARKGELNLKDALDKYNVSVLVSLAREMVDGPRPRPASDQIKNKFAYMYNITSQFDAASTRTQAISRK